MNNEKSHNCENCNLLPILIENSSISLLISSDHLNQKVQTIEDRIKQILFSINSKLCSKNLFEIQIMTSSDKMKNNHNYSHLFLTRENNTYLDRILSIPVKLNINNLNSTIYKHETLFIRHNKKIKSNPLENATAIAMILSRFMEGKDIETHHHNLRVGEMNSYFSQKMQNYFIENKIEHEITFAFQSNPNYDKYLQIGGILHDVGKLFIPQEILLKSSTLTTEEFNFMKNHTSYGEQILYNLPSMEKSSLISKYHHEKWNGEGYIKLQGDKIPLVARITAFTDILDALITKRPYKREYSYNEVYDFFFNGKIDLKGGFDNHFEPTILNFAKNNWEEISAYHFGLKNKYPN